MRFFNRVIIFLLVIATQLHALRANADEDQTALEGARNIRVYFVGNSVTDTVKYGLLAELAASRGNKITWGRHVIPGAPLSFILNSARESRAEGFTEKPYGNCLEALKNYEWDVLCLQPFDRRLLEDDDREGRPNGDIAAIQFLIDLAKSKNPNVQVLLYARWPRITVDGKSVNYDKDSYDKNITGVSPVKSGDGKNDSRKLDDFANAWNTPYTGGWGMQLESKDYFEKLLVAVRKANPEIAEAIQIIPVGYVMDELNTAMKEGKINGYRDIHDIYQDGIHLDNVGSYMVACTFYATIFGDSPLGLSAERYEVRKPNLARTIEETVWRVVDEHQHFSPSNPSK